jgi:putative phosphoesterase
MRIALISDLHANVVAFDAVMHDIERRGADEIVCLGDVATLGPQPGAMIERLRGLGCPCILGNHDEFLLDPALIHTYTEAPVVVDAVDWCRDQLPSKDLDFLRTFERGREMSLEGGATLLLFHGSPKSHMDDLLATTPPEELDRLLGGHTATVMAGGHTHVQMLRQHRGMLLVNPGSLGMPFKEYVSGRAPTVLDHAEYATVESTRRDIRVQLHRVALDRSALREAVRDSANPLSPMLLEQYS